LHGSTVVFPGSYSLLMNISDYSLFLANPNPQYFGSLLNNITGAITEGFRRLLSARDGSVFSVPLDFQTRSAQHPSQMIIEASALVVALNATEPSSYAGWYESATAAFKSKASSAIQSLNLLSPQNFKARFIAQSCSALFVPCHVIPANISFLHTGFTLMRSLQMYPLANSAVQTIPALRQNEAAQFEFSAAPSLLQRFPPPPHLQLLASSSVSILQDLGARFQKRICNFLM
jgi:hypothetical protein